MWAIAYHWHQSRGAAEKGPEFSCLQMGQTELWKSSDAASEMEGDLGPLETNEAERIEEAFGRG